MPAPVPLTACDPPQLDWSRPSAPAATDYGDIYFSVEGGLTETETVFLKGCGLPERWQGRKQFVIGELGFGSGLNFLAAWQLWERTKPQNGHLHFISIEKHPFDKAALSRALTLWPELEARKDRLLALWPGRVKGLHRLHISPSVTLTLIHDDIDAAFSQTDAKADAWFLDGFSPAKNPDMWSGRVMQNVAKHSAPGARVGTFTVAGAVRQALIAAGFEVEKKEGFGRKRHRLEARFPGKLVETQNRINPIIIGAGIAGACLARSFLRRGIVPTIIDAGDGTAASGNPAAIVKPRLDLQDRPESRFFLSSYLYALQVYEEEGAVMSRNVYHAAKTEADKIRFDKLTRNQALPTRHMRMEKGPYETSGLFFPQACVIDPVNTCDMFLDGANFISDRIREIKPAETGVGVINEKGEFIAKGTHVFLAMGAGVKSFEAMSDLALRYSRGQITTAKCTVDATLTYGGYAIPLGDNMLLGATHARLSTVDPYISTDEDDQENVEKFKEISGEVPRIIPGASRASVRVTAPNTLPLIANVQDNVTALTGLGSRGFVFAPLLAEDIVAKLCGEPGALTIQQRQAFRRERSPT